MFVCCVCCVLSGRGLCDELITRPEESYRLWCVVMYDLETSRIGAPYIYDISNLRVNLLRQHMQWNWNNTGSTLIGIIISLLAQIQILALYSNDQQYAVWSVCLLNILLNQENIKHLERNIYVCTTAAYKFVSKKYIYETINNLFTSEVYVISAYVCEVYIYFRMCITSVISGSLSPRHSTSSGCGWRNSPLYGG